MSAATRDSTCAGPGDVIAARDLRHTTLPCGESWTATVPSRIALLDDRFLLAARRWPRLVSAMFELLGEQRDRLMMQLVIAEQPRVEDRLLMLFWQLADRFGRVTREGITIQLALTHEALGRLIGARRPTVTLALRMLGERGAIERQAGPQLAREGAPAGHRRDRRGPVRRHAAAAAGARAAQLAVVISSR